jgi:hypothetical protein
LPQYDIVSHQLFDEFEQILQRQFSVICGAVPDLPGQVRQEFGGYGGIHVVMEGYSLMPESGCIRYCFVVILCATLFFRL